MPTSELIPPRSRYWYLRWYLRNLEQLVIERDRMMAEIPECEVHGGQCIPHAIEWVQKARAAMSETTWEQKFEAMQGLGEASLKMRAPGKWYVSQPNVESTAVGRDKKPRPGDADDGDTPVTAVENRWKLLTETEVKCKRGRLMRRVRWNGFMWADVPEPDDVEAAATT